MQNLRTFLTRNKREWFVPVCVALLLLLGASAVVVYKAKIASNNSDVFVYDCDPNDPQSFACLQQKYVKIAQTKGISTALADLNPISDTGNPVEDGKCHEIAHAIGREAFVEYKTLSNAFAHGNSVCGDGYYHGVMEAASKKLGQKAFNNTFTTICNGLSSEENGSYVGRINCVHSVGHGIMFDNGDNVFTSIKLCDRFATELDQSACYSGVFMENFILVVTYGEHSKYLKSDDVQYPCDAVASKYKTNCYQIQVGYILQLFNNNYSKVATELCAKEQDNYAQTCYTDLGFSIIDHIHDPEKTMKTCLSVTSDSQTQATCMTGAIEALVTLHGTTSLANQACLVFQPYLQDNCYDMVKDYAKSKSLITQS